MSIIDTGNQSLMFGLFILCSVSLISKEYYMDIKEYFVDKIEIDGSYDTKVFAIVASFCIFITLLCMIGFKHYLVVTGSKVYMTEEYYTHEKIQ
jgi:hypothetical protein